ncbi:glycosyltransferase family 4 protein [Thermobrachium celere]|uniref:Probable hexosyltransferase n=1 Tax=Thermobrachium celere DSM 8682 TaxID=941824 RepID=R7RNU7_9CLOT|nr:glycosyltransferase family 4 protein [Thermobrachium celere]CDF57724.1 probable hexosyltransferase [Thermobrachium celere DSM 8682]
MSRILLINTFYYPNMIGGTEHTIKLLAEGLASKGHNVAVFTCDSNKDFLKEEINGVTIYRDKVVIKNKGFFKPIYKAIELNNRIILSRLDKVIDEFKPDVINTHNLFYISPYIWKYIKLKFSIPIVHTIHDLWLYCPKATYLKRNGQQCENKHLYCKYHEFVNKKHSMYVDFVTSPSRYAIDFFGKRGYFLKSKKMVIPNNIDIDIEKTIDLIKYKNEIKDKKVNFVFLGNLLFSKGLNWLIETFKEIENKNINLIICGDGPLRDYVIKETQNDNRIIYKGHVSGKQKEDILVQGDVLIMPSICNETFGRVIVEAYKYGMPVIGSNLGGIPEVIKNNETGLIVEASDKKQLKDAIEYMVLRKNQIKFRDNITKYINNYNNSEHIKNFENVFSEL